MTKATRALGLFFVGFGVHNIFTGTDIFTQVVGIALVSLWSLLVILDVD